MTFTKIDEDKSFDLQEQASNTDVDLHLVAAILMFSVIRANGDIDHELDNMVDILRSRYALSSEQISALITSARDASISDHGLELLAQKLWHHWNSNERQQTLNDFWLLATADRIIKNDERLVIELIANNLELEDVDITHARYQAEQRLELNIG
jgi:uncharacterized tellurite resistance protein B-like protein